MTTQAATPLTPLENNALNWVVLCEQLKLDLRSTSALDVLLLVKPSQ